MAVQRPDQRARTARAVSNPHGRHLPAIRPLTARSVVLSVLLGYHPPELPVSALVRVGALFDIAERTTRVAVSRMVGEGDLVSDNGVYRLAERQVRRQARMEDSAAPAVKAWNGDWQMAVVTSPARPQADRVALRRGMVDLRLAELREGVWLRPDNLMRPVDGVTAHQCTLLRCQYPDAAGMVERLWDLADWAEVARRIHEDMAGPISLKDDFMLIAEGVRHLRIDPYLPPELLPEHWPGPELRARHVAFRDDFARRLREYSTA